MLFFESKHYAPKYQTLKLEGESNNSQRNRIAEISIARTSNRGGSWVLTMLREYTQPLLPLTGYLVNFEKIVEEWELVEDLVCYSRYHNNNYTLDLIDEHMDRVYYNNEHECFAFLNKNSMGEYPKSQTNCIYFPFLVKPNGVFKSFFEQGYIIEDTDPPVPEINILVHTKTGYALSKTEIPGVSIDIKRMYNEGFEDVSKKIVTHVNKKNDTGLIILHGTPGTGKTSYLRWLSGQTSRKFVFVPPDMVSALSKPAFLDFLLANTGLTFIVEDAEIALKPREGNSNSIVSTILNLTDGLLGDVLSCQFICTFNTDLDKIESALLRPGRLIVRHEFKPLTTERANEYLEHIGRESKVDKPTVLAELMNLDSMPTTIVEKEKPQIGFLSR